MEYPTIEDMIKHYGISSILEEIPVEDAISTYSVGTMLENIDLLDVILHYDREDLIEALDINYMDHVTSEDCYNTYGTDLLGHFSDSDLWDAIDEQWGFTEDYVSSNYSASDVADAYGDSPYLLEYLIENEVSNGAVAEILMKYSEYQEILKCLNLIKTYKKSFLHDVLKTQRSINAQS